MFPANNKLALTVNQTLKKQPGPIRHFVKEL